MLFVRFVERLSLTTGAVAAFLVLPLIASLFIEVVSRYGFGHPTFWSYEISYMLAGTIFLLGAPYTLRQKEHVSVDFIYAALSKRKQALINIAGYILFIPVLLLLVIALYDYALNAYLTGEVSGKSAWNPVVWPFRSMWVIGFSGLFLQSVAEIVKSIVDAVGGTTTSVDDDG